MTWQGWAQILVYLAVLTALVPPLGGYMARVYLGRRLALERVLGPVERGFYRGVRTDPAREQDWKQYGRTVLVFSALFWVVLYAILRLQGRLPFNPLRFGGAPWNVTFHTTSSFITNTNWQYYGGETTMSFLSQMAGLAVQNFVSAAVGMAVLAAVIRGFARQETTRLGNFWVDLTRSLLYILLPLSVIGTLLLASQGVVQTLTGSVPPPQHDHPGSRHRREQRPAGRRGHPRPAGRPPGGGPPRRPRPRGRGGRRRRPRGAAGPRRPHPAGCRRPRRRRTARAGRQLRPVGGRPRPQVGTTNR
jgi:hypothetical protein